MIAFVLPVNCILRYAKHCDYNRPKRLTATPTRRVGNLLDEGRSFIFETNHNFRPPTLR